MEPKPFSLQAPEDIAKTYAGNKQKIAQAMQMGVVDPTAGLLAGMFIDRMRAAQTQEQAGPPQTVAQQVFSPQSGPPPQQPGGLDALQVPDQMFSAPPGGVVPPQQPPQAQPPMPQQAPPMGAPPAFAMGGPVARNARTPPWMEALQRMQAAGMTPTTPTPTPAPRSNMVASPPADPDFDAFKRAIIQQESGGRYGVANAEGSGAMGIGQVMPDTGRVLARRLGLEWRPDLMAGDDEASRSYQDKITDAALREAYDYGRGDMRRAAGYYYGGSDTDKWGPRTRQYMDEIIGRMGGDVPEIAGTPTPASIPEQAPDRMSFEQAMGLVNNTLGTPDPYRQQAVEYYERLMSPNEQKKRKKEDMWEALASFGANLAGTSSPYFLQAVGQAGQQTMPRITESTRARRGEEQAATQALAGIEGQRSNEATQRFGLGMGLYETELKAGQAEAALEQQAAMNRLDNQTRKEIADLEVMARREAIAAAQSNDATDFDKAVSTYQAYLARRQRAGLPIVDTEGRPVRSDTANGELDARVLQRLALEYAAKAMGKTGDMGVEVPLPPGMSGGTGNTTSRANVVNYSDLE